MVGKKGASGRKPGTGRPKGSKNAKTGYDKKIDGIYYRVERCPKYPGSRTGPGIYYVYRMPTPDIPWRRQQDELEPTELLAVVDHVTSYEKALREWLLLECYQYCLENEETDETPERFRKLIPKIHRRTYSLMTFGQKEEKRKGEWLDEGIEEKMPRDMVERIKEREAIYKQTEKEKRQKLKNF